MGIFNDRPLPTDDEIIDALIDEMSICSKLQSALLQQYASIINQHIYESECMKGLTEAEFKFWREGNRAAIIKNALEKWKERRKSRSNQ